MLFNIEIGFKSKETWKVITDDHGNTFLAKPNIRQRIRIDNKLIANKDFTFVNLLSDIEDSKYAIAINNTIQPIKYVNNNKNMNPMIMPIYKNDQDKSGLNAIYITLSARYKILKYNCNYRILQSYHCEDSYQGCAVICTDDEIAAVGGDVIITMNVKDTKTKDFYDICVYFDDINGDIVYRMLKISNISTIKGLTNIDKKFKNSLGFKIKARPGEFITCTYFVSPEMKDVIEEKTANIKNKNIVVITPEVLNDADKLDALLTEELTNKRIRTFTTCGLDLPLNVCKKYRQLYVFKYDHETDKLICKKSN